MAMTAGIVTIDGSGNPNAPNTMARAIYDAFLPLIDTGALTGADLQKARQAIADTGNAIAAGVVAHIAAHAEVTVTVSASDAGLQRLPASLTENEPTKAPAAPVSLSTKGTIA